MQRIERLDSVWLFATAQNSWQASKAGLWAIRANNLKSIDERSLETHKHFAKIQKECYDMQETSFQKWLIFSTIMLTVF